MSQVQEKGPISKICRHFPSLNETQSNIFLPHPYRNTCTVTIYLHAPTHTHTHRERERTDKIKDKLYINNNLAYHATIISYKKYA